jgi:hypothetical protein
VRLFETPSAMTPTYHPTKRRATICCEQAARGAFAI